MNNRIIYYNIMHGVQNDLLYSDQFCGSCRYYYDHNIVH